MTNAEVSRVLERFALGGSAAIVSDIVKLERERGFTVVRPGEADWFPLALWKSSSVCSTDGNRVRIVLIDAAIPNRGAFRRLIYDIVEMDMIPVVVDPHDGLAATLASWGWRHRRVGQGFGAENLWYPRR